jgi:phosphatidylethanolamine-binding protein (PEBP) family uncharacterized protein
MGGTNSLVSLDVEGLTDESLKSRENAEIALAYGDNTVTQGCTMVPTNTASAPSSVKWVSEGNEGKKYTLIVSDPDAPSRETPSYREFIHWVRSDITAEALATGTIDGTDTLAYVGPAPPHSSGPHRYIFILFEQGEGNGAEALATAFEGRGGKKAVTCAQAAGLGQIMALNIFSCEWDESVDALHKAIGFLPPPQYRSPQQKEENPEAAAAAEPAAAAAAEN